MMPAFPLVCLRLSCSPLPSSDPRSVPEGRGALKHLPSNDFCRSPHGPSLRSSFFCPGPSTLNRPYLPHSQAHPDFTALAAYTRCLRCAHCAYPLVETNIGLQAVSQMKPPMVMTEKIVLKKRIEAISFSPT
jgi:hypothetical protein